MQPFLTVCCFVLVVQAGVADQRNANVALERATNAFKQGRFEEAGKQLDAAARADSKKPEIPNLRGAIFTRQKRYEEAAQQFSEALALDPKFYPAKLNLAEVKLLQGQYGEAAEQYQALKQADPDSETLDFKLVLCALLEGNQAKASGIVDLMKFPGTTPAYYYARAAIALRRGDNELAQKYLENVKKYYAEVQCRYFAQSLEEVNLTSATQSRPQETPDPRSGKVGNSGSASQ
ncbi:MAG: tetratricopeptide repeat protein [Verrucomicrobia bacterium]|nr:tetratricopeptide repeat protein [Verrucomicrobiota bacterium]